MSWPLSELAFDRPSALDKERSFRYPAQFVFLSQIDAGLNRIAPEHLLSFAYVCSTHQKVSGNVSRNNQIGTPRLLTGHLICQESTMR